MQGKIESQPAQPAAAQIEINQNGTFPPAYITEAGGNQTNSIQIIQQGQNQFVELIPPPPVPQQRKAQRKSQPKAKVLPPDLNIEGPSSNKAYKIALVDAQLTVSPQALGFLPSNYWLNLDSTFGDLVTKFFQRKNNANCRFPHKLYNALSIVEQDPKMYNLLGVKWITDTVFKVDKLLFGRVLGISSIDGGLFHQQGNFPSHGFCEVSGQELEQLKTNYNLTDIDQDRVRLMHHPDGLFQKSSNEDDVNRCKWGNTQ
ncbi:hypothetical protein TRFO_07753 [Tritrichomonas foetus]|uniref:Initiator binding domain-containing protein n=1 Tax=Tritrichomonas foetus TaxID=1144522 RepID=A0A1J4JQT5_9EUKA|nr:hypothetical protein TRFO_07753 [Tritrichomonas foetus]|eukprot:OHT00776.1 hypothetical protein TRFO_07753 [Tritrichomonas foetus]